MKDKVKKTIIASKEFCIDIFGWVRSLWILCFRSIYKPGIFYGYSVYWFAKRYAEKRTAKWPANYDQAGKLQGMFPVGDTKIIICSTMELKLFQKAGMITEGINVRKYFKRRNYYKTDYKTKSNGNAKQTS